MRPRGLDARYVIAANWRLAHDGKHVGRRLVGLNRKTSIVACDIHQTIINLISGIIAGPLCKLFRAVMDQGEVFNNWSGGAVLTMLKGLWILLWKTSDPSPSPVLYAVWRRSWYVSIFRDVQLCTNWPAWLNRASLRTNLVRPTSCASWM